MDDDIKTKLDPIIPLPDVKISFPTIEPKLGGDELSVKLRETYETTVKIEEPENGQAVIAAALASKGLNPNGTPRKLSACEQFEHFDPDVVSRIGVKFNGVERKGDVAYYDCDEGFIRIHLRDNKGRWKQSRGKFVTYKLQGVVEPYWRR